VIDFNGSHFEREIVLWGVRWYVAYPISDRQLEEMMEERGVEVRVGARKPPSRLTSWPRWKPLSTPREGAMIMLRIEPGLFSALRAGFEAAACDDDAPISPKLLSRLRPALANAAAAAPPRRPILVMLESVADLYALGDCFTVGGEGHPRVTDAQWEAINALIDQAAGAAAT
jgi:hypothetical protein